MMKHMKSGGIIGRIKRIFFRAADEEKPAKVSFYIRTYEDGGRWFCEEGEVFSDGSEKMKSRDSYPTEAEAEHAKLMQLH